MIRYRYATHLAPPAPFIKVSPICEATGARTDSLPAQVEPAADRTVLPRAVIDALSLQEYGRLQVQGFSGEVVELPVFRVVIAIHELPPITVRAALGEHEPCVLLGRDVLNSLRMLLDGPALALEIG